MRDRLCRTCGKRKPPASFSDGRARRCDACKAAPPARVNGRRCHTCGDARPVSSFAGLYGKRCEDCRANPPVRLSKCFHCWHDLPRSAFPPRAHVCFDCRDAEREAKRPPATFRRGNHTVRRCSDCETVKPLSERHFYRDATRTRKIGRQEFMRICILCQRERSRLRARRHKAEDPEGYRERRRGWQRRYKRNHPEKHRQWERDRDRRIKADPKRHAVELERDRISYRLRRERRDGVPVTELRSLTPRGPVPDDQLPAVPTGPIVDLLLARARGSSIEEVSASVGIDPRQLRAWANGEWKTIQFGVADRILTALEVSWWQVYPREFGALEAEAIAA